MGVIGLVIVGIIASKFYVRKSPYIVFHIQEYSQTFPHTYLHTVTAHKTHTHDTILLNTLNKNGFLAYDLLEKKMKPFLELILL